MRKFTLFVASLFCFVGVLHAEALVADGVYKLSADVNQQRGELVAAEGYNYPVLDGIDLSGYTQNSTAAKANGQYWYVQSAGQGDNTYYLYNIAQRKYLVNEDGNVNFGDTPYVWTFVTNASKPDYLNIKDAARTSSVWLSSGCGRNADQRPVQWDSNNNDGGALYTFTYVGNYFATPETGKYYKIKGEGELPWLTAEVTSKGNVVVSANEADAAVFLKTANGLQAIATGKYLGYASGKYTYSDTELGIELRNTGDYLANYSNKYAIVSAGNYMFNNNNDGIVHESDQAIPDLPRLWAFTEVENVVHIAGAGIEDNPYVIDNAEELILFRNSVNAGETTYNAEGVYVALGADIDLAGVANWEPIGSWDYSFDGNFDGQGHKIMNLKMSDNSAANGEAYLGLFGITANNVIKDFVIENVTIESAGQIVAAAIAYPYYTTVSGITVCGDIAIKGGNYTAGVLAYTRLCLNASNLVVSGNANSYITGANTVGGVISDIQLNHGLKATYSNFSVSNVTITGVKSVGGISGIISGQTLNGASVKNVTLDSEDGVAGVVAGRLGDASTISNVDTEKVTGATAIVGATYDGARPVEILEHNGVYTIKSQFISGEGTEANPYLIKSVEELVFFRNSVNAGETKYNAPGVHVALGADIDLAGENWVGIGSAYKDHGFMGNFDGKTFKIKNLTITDPAIDSDGYVYAGLFSVTEGTDQNNQNVIKNLTIENVNISTTGHIVSAAIAYPYYTVVENVNVCGNIAITGGNYTAGALAYTRRCVNASNITVAGNAGSITGAQVVGGVISDIQMNGGLKATYSNFSVSGVSIEGTKMVGGISGIICEQTLAGASVSNVSLTSRDNRVGIVSGSLGGVSTITDVTFDNVTGATAIVGATYDGGNPVEAKIGDTYYATLEAAMAAEGTDNVELLVEKSIVLKDGEAYTYTKGAADVDVEYTRTLIAGIWNPVYIPFDATIRADEADEFEVAEFTAAEGTTITLTKLEANEDGDIELSANTAYVVRPVDGTNTLSLAAWGYIYSNEEEPQTLGENGFSIRGNYSVLAGSELGANDRIVSKDGKWAKLAGTSTLKPFRLILTIPAGVDASAISMRVEDEDTTSIETLETMTEVTIYDLMGRRVETMTEGGIYIVNGKKVIR